MSSLSKLLKLIRIEHGMSQFDLAEKIGSSYSYISRFEAGKVDPRWSTVVKMFRVLDSAVFVDGYLFNIIDKKNA